MNRTFGSCFIAISTAAIFAGCVDGPGAESTAATSDNISTVPAVPGSPVASAMWAKAPLAPGLAPAQALASRSADALVASRPAFLQASPKDAFVQRSVVSSSGLIYVAYERTHAGLPVVGGDFVIVTDTAGLIAYNSSAQQSLIDLPSLTPTLSQASAEAIARRPFRSVTRVEGTQLVVNALGDTARLAWESTIDGFGANGISRLTVHVDAITGAVLHEQEHVLYGTGTSAWSGPNPVTLNTTQSGATFSMRDPTITNLSCQDAANNTTFSGADDLWGNGNATVRETGCVDALFGAQTEARMLTQWLGRNAMDGAGGAWPIRVGLADVNAFYDGSQVQVGHNNANQWIGAIDVIAHEMGHGIDDHTPGGISGSGTQEFVADTFGASTESFANEPAPFDVPDFTVGEQINLVGSGPIRNMANPAALGDPNCFSSAIPTTEVHAAAGPGNHWFYLLANGTNPTNGQPTSPTCNSSTVVGLGVQNAIRIMYNAMLLKTTGSSYLKYRTWTLQAAKNLFPGSCTEFNTVKAAWDAVSVPAQAADPTCGTTPPPPPGCINSTFSSTDVPKAIPDNNATGITSVLPVTGNGTVASLSLSLNITHTFRGDLVVTLVAPDGTSFIVSNRAGGSADNIVISNMAITTFNGHTGAGTWQLKVQDRAAADVGTLNSWSLAIVGNCGGGGVNWSGSASPNLATLDNGSVCSSLSVATTGGDSSQAKLDIAGRHDFCSVLSGTLAHNGTTVTAFPTNTFANGACNFTFSNRAVAGLSGDSAGTWTFCVRDNDAFGDTGTLNTWSVHN
jgi:Zn-dependent metalloprotease/subtilisin-like proprotein convertase family protein